MKSYHKIIVTALLVSTLVTTVNAQLTNSPYSRAGYGILTDNATGTQRAMGGVGYAMQDGQKVNTMNPASYAKVDSLTFLWDIGFDLTNLWSKENGQKGYNFGGGLDYINAEFRIANHLGASFGLVPFSTVNYSFDSELDNGSENRTGSGTLNEIYYGMGYEPFKGFSLGANVSYLFGTLSNGTVISASSTSYFERVVEVRDWNLKLGAQFAVNFNRNDQLTLGVVYSPKKSFHGHSWGTYYDAQDTKADTVGYTSLKGNNEKPNSFGVGLAFNHGTKLLAEVDFTYEQWSKAKYHVIEGFESANTHFNNRWKVAAGLQWVPNNRANSYHKRMSYRIGGHFNYDYMSFGNNKVRDYGVSIGIGLPAAGIGNKTVLNLGVEYMHRGTSPTNLISENYLNITASLNFNELFFWKNKIR
ncbi:MAG: hypothetical protein IK092_04725 [Muribaculaceae bacterium]|nr:hypothetical protein [Muribaculaceae bacterium]